MITRFPSLSLRDHAFLQGVAGPPPAPIGTNDPNTMVWYKASEHITHNSYIGDKMDTTTNKASSGSPNMNLVRFAGTPVFPSVLANNNANMAQYSENLQIGHTVSGFTINTPVLGTFTAQNGYIRSQIAWCGDQPGVTYVFKLKIRNISGNTNLHIYHLGSATGASTPVTIDGTLTEYTVEFLAPAAPTLAFYIGIQDQNAAGHGQIETTEWHLYRKNEHDTTYVANANLPGWPYRDGYAAWCGGIGTSGGFNQPGSFRTHPGGPMTIYLTMWLRNRQDTNYLVLCNRPGFYTWIFGINVATGFLRLYSGGAWGANGTVAVPLKQWCVVTGVFNGPGAGFTRVNKSAADAGGVAVLPANDRTQCHFDSASGAIARVDAHEMIVRYTADNTATQDSFIEYLGGQVGLSL